MSFAKRTGLAAGLLAMTAMAGAAGADQNDKPDGSVSPVGSASTESDLKQVEPGIPIQKIIAAVARKDGRKYFLDPRVRASVQLIGQDISNITSAGLQTILLLHGYMEVEEGGYIVVMPDANARQVAIPMLTGKESYPDGQIVTTVIQIRNVPAGYLVPLLRPLVPQYGDVSASFCSNSLIVVDRFANVKRLEAMVRSLDIGEPYKPEKKCAPPT